MKKLAFLLVLVCMLSTLMVGCSLIFSNDDCDHDTDETPESLPTLEELAALNAFAEMLKTYDSVYMKNVCTAVLPENSYVEDAVFLPGNGKIDYHMRSTKTATNVITEDLSRIGDEWYYYDINDATYAVLERGESYILDYTVPDLFGGVLPLGKAYVDGDNIVHHGYRIQDAFEEYGAKRYDYTYYFDKETKLLKNIEVVVYDDQHTVIETNVVEITINANIYDVFEKTLLDKVYESEKRIDIEIVVGYGTDDEEKYSLVATTDAVLYGVFDSETYLLYTDPECQSPVLTLDGFAGEAAVTLYASKLTFDEEIRYTVTEEEWYVYTEQLNFTIEQISDGYHLIHRYTDDALEMEDTIVIFIGDRQYMLEEGEDGYVAYDCTNLAFSHVGMFDGASYDVFTFDEELCAYVCDATEEIGTRWEIRFENGVPVSMIVTMITDVNGVETVSTIESYYTNVGTTVIDIPEYVFAEDEDDDVRKTVTEDEWNLYVNEGNFAGIFYTLIEDEYSEYSFKSSGNAMEIDGKYIVFDSGKKYMLREQDGVWYASEWNEFDICATMIPAGLSFDDFVYSEGLEMYVQKEDTGTEIFYSIGFEDGVLTHILVQESLDPTDPGYLEIFGFDVTEIGGVEIDVPEYVIAE